MSAITQLIRSVGGTRFGPSTDDEPERSTRPESSLYQCPSCDSVYVAVDKRTCESCDTGVDQVPATLAD